MSTYNTISAFSRKLASSIKKRPDGLASTIKNNAKHLLENLPEDEIIKMALKWGSEYVSLGDVNNNLEVEDKDITKKEFERGPTDRIPKVSREDTESIRRRVRNTLFCVYCWDYEKIKTPVEFRAGFGSSTKFADGKREEYVTNTIFTYFSCPYHGAVPAYDSHFNYYPKPSDFFETIVFNDWDAAVRKGEKK